MKRQDPISESQVKDPENTKYLRRVLRVLVPKNIFTSITQRDSATWKPHFLAACAFLWMACNEKNLTDAFGFVRKILPKIFTTAEDLAWSYQGFMDQLGRYNSRLMGVILPHFRNLTKSMLVEYWLVYGVVPSNTVVFL